MTERHAKPTPAEDAALALGAIGFGFVPHESEAHFTVTIGAADVTISEHSGWTGSTDADLVTFGPSTEHVVRVVLDRARWDRIAMGLEQEFNGRLRRRGLPTSRFKSGRVPLGRLYGKEAVLLAWAVEEADPALCPQGLTNWLGLTPEERWWLYTMTAAATGHATKDRGRGWRKALRFALTENPVGGFRAASTPPVPVRIDDFAAPIVSSGGGNQLGLLGVAPASGGPKKKPARSRKAG